MARLGYERYGLQGGDWGSLVSANVADLHPERVVGLHLNMVTAAPPVDGAPVTERGAARARRGGEWRRTGVGYQEIQGTRPQSLGYGAGGLAGRAGGVDRREVPRVEPRRHRRGVHVRSAPRQHHRLLGDRHGGVVAADLLGDAPGPPARRCPQRRVEVPTCVAQLPGEISYPPRAWTEAAYNVVRWSTPARGGHFAAMEAPEAFVDDVRAFFAELPSIDLTALPFS